MSPRIEAFDPESSLEGLKLHNDLIEETRDEAAARVRLQQQEMMAYFNEKVEGKQFLINDLVLMEAAVSHPTVTGKLKTAWGGPYKIA